MIIMKMKNRTFKFIDLQTKLFFYYLYVFSFDFFVIKTKIFLDYINQLQISHNIGSPN
jgi:hypothetical protein